MNGHPLDPLTQEEITRAAGRPYQDPQSPVGKRAGFMFHHFWATRYAEGELYPAGMYPNQHLGGGGLKVPLLTAVSKWFTYLDLR